MQPRTVSTTYTLGHDAGNRLTAVSGSATATFTYDGDSNRVKGTVNGAATVYIGAYFEWTSAGSTQYYSAGSTRLAMRRSNYASDNGLFFILGDHLGSTSLTTDAAGARLSELMFKPWGETRFTYGTTRTTYRFTGQREESSLGIYYYNARWYDSSLGRFLQADTIVPGVGSQSWDRYAYVGNNPMNRIDPSGHRACDDDGYCETGQRAPTIDYYASIYGIKFGGKPWTTMNKWAVILAVQAVGRKYRTNTKATSWEAFRSVHHGIEFISGLEGATGQCGGITSGACTSSSRRINFVDFVPASTNWKSASEAFVQFRNNVVHEIGHAFASKFPSRVANPNYPGETIVNKDHPYNKFDGSFLDERGWPDPPEGASMTWRQHPSAMDNGVFLRGEVFADMYLGWVFNEWGTEYPGPARQEWMTTNMVEYLNQLR